MHIYLLFSTTWIFPLALSFLVLSLKRDPPSVSLLFSISPHLCFPISQQSELTFPSITGRFIPRALLLSICPIYVLSRYVSLRVLTILRSDHTGSHLNFVSVF